MKVRVSAPGTIANLGPGFDIFALAVQLHNDVEAERIDGSDVTIEIADDQQTELINAKKNLVAISYLKVCDELNIPERDRGVVLRCTNRIPLARGLGSSAAAALSGVLVATTLHRAPWDLEAVLAAVTRIEGHADNAGAALHGGMVICIPNVVIATIPIPEELSIVIFVPESEGPTAAARAVVPKSFAREDAVFNASRCALLVHAMQSKNFHLLDTAMEDCWHQPGRAVIYPHLFPLINAARDGGARGAALAGGGSSVFALVEGEVESVVDAFSSCAKSLNVGGKAMGLKPRNFGTRVDVTA